MIIAILPEDRGRFAQELHEMHRLRYRVFHQRLGWEVTTVGDLELDEFDSCKPIYVLQIDARGLVNGCARLLPSTGPTMLGKTFPLLLGEASHPSDRQIWESSRFAVDLDGRAVERTQTVGQITLELFAGVMELGLRLGWTHIMTVTDLRLERLGARAGLNFERFAPPLQVGKTQAVAGIGRVSRDTLAALRAFGAPKTDVLRLSSDFEPVAFAA